MKIDGIGDPPSDIEQHIYFAGIAAEVNRIALRSLSLQGDHPPHHAETMARILVLKGLHNLTDDGGNRPPER